MIDVHPAFPDVHDCANYPTQTICLTTAPFPRQPTPATGFGTLIRMPSLFKSVQNATLWGGCRRGGCRIRGCLDMGTVWIVLLDTGGHIGGDDWGGCLIGVAVDSG
jgi:hypothetical protein